MRNQKFKKSIIINMNRLAFLYVIDFDLTAPQSELSFDNHDEFSNDIPQEIINA